MSMILWTDEENGYGFDTGLDWVALYAAFAKMDHLSGMKGYEELFGVIDAAETYEDVNFDWFRTVQEQAQKYLDTFKDEVPEEARDMLEGLTKYKLPNKSQK